MFAHHSLPEAVSKGRRKLFKQKERKAYFSQTIDLEDWMLPVMYQNRPVNFNLRDFTPQEEEAYFQQRELRHKISHTPFYGFFGRDLDIMTIEKRLLQHNMLLLRGMGGTGKSTLLDYLAWWWEKTGFVKRSFYFGYDERAFTLEQILFSLAKRLYDNREFALFQSSNLATQKGKIVDVLKSERFCLILGNCESITGSPLAIQNTLPKDEQEKLKGFLRDLSGGKSFIVFGSRGEEPWIGKETFKRNIHHLQGLDPEARSDLAVRILKEVDIEFPEHDPEFHHLMKLLAGYPLAMEVVLPNLKRYNPAQIIESLKAGDVDLERQNGKDKTESILKCVDYSHGNLSPDAQKLLLCFAPFNSVINLGWLPQYTEQLKRLPTFQDWPFQLWEEVIQETVNWGLMEPLGQDVPIMTRMEESPISLKDYDSFMNHRWIKPWISRYERDSLVAEAAVIRLMNDLYNINKEYREENERNIFKNIEKRVKTQDSFFKKFFKICCENAKTQGISQSNLQEFYEKVLDLGGVRFVCPYHDDVKFAINELIRPKLNDLGYATVLEEKCYVDKNYLDAGDEFGYRSYHFYVAVPAPIDIFGNVEFFTCEVQGRSELQHIWAAKSHDLIYKPSEGHKIEDQLVIDDMRQLSNILRAADQFFVSIRKRARGDRNDEENY